MLEQCKGKNLVGTEKDMEQKITVSGQCPGTCNAIDAKDTGISPANARRRERVEARTTAGTAAKAEVIRVAVKEVDTNVVIRVVIKEVEKAAASRTRARASDIKACVSSATR